uniref:DAF-12 n=1 Tax=Bursaphelenchus xylophilus TaxID=6326 RepID=A0A1I7SM99_BURXY
MDPRLGAVFAAINVSSTTGLHPVCASSLTAVQPTTTVVNTTDLVQSSFSPGQTFLSSSFGQSLLNGGATSPPELPIIHSRATNHHFLDPSTLNLAKLAPETLQNLNKLVSQPVENLRSSPILTYLRGAVVQALSQSGSSSGTSTPDEPPALPEMSPIVSSSEIMLPEPVQDVPRRIRRRRPKSPKAVNKPSPKRKPDDDEQQMNTPDDPVIHSPSSSRAMFGANPLLMSSAMGDPQDNSEESRRRQKTCRVCGDHATGYNFNVITCESCKAFFRRNALRPKEFKCPYSDDCEINAVSRRFCQKCRLRKCFAVGMKKEWILNDEQLRRRKNSRLNSMKGMANSPNYSLSPHQLMHSPQSSIMMNRNPADVMAQVKTEVSDQPHSSLNEFRLPFQQNYDLQQFLQSANPTASPASSGFNSPSLMQRRQSDLALSPISQGPSSINSLLSPQSVASPESPVTILGNQVTSTDLNKQIPPLSDIQHMMKQGFSTSDDYSRFLQSESKVPHPTATSGSAFSTPFKVDMVMSSSSQPLGQSGCGSEASSTYSMNGNQSNEYDPYKTFFSKDAGKFSPSSLFPFLDMSPDGYQKMADTIHDELHNVSGDIPLNGPASVDFKTVNHNEPASQFQLNSSELFELDVVRNAYSCMDEPLADHKSKAYLTKKSHNPADIMNIMDISMRRFVKMTKKLPAFNTLNAETKLHLLKAAMISLLTLRGATRFDVQKLCFTTRISGQAIDISLDMFDKLNEKNQKMKFIKFCLNMDANLRHNDTIINLMGLVVLFRNTNVITIESDKQLTKKYHTLYSNLLRRYVESIHAQECMPIIESIPKTLECLRDISSSAENLYVGKVSSDEIEQLPTEFFRTEFLTGVSSSSSQPAASQEGTLEPGSSTKVPFYPTSPSQLFGEFNDFLVLFY